MKKLLFIIVSVLVVFFSGSILTKPNDRIKENRIKNNHIIIYKIDKPQGVLINSSARG